MGCKVRLVHEADMDSSDKLTRFFSSGNGKFSYITGMVDLQNLDALELTSGGRKVVRIIYGACPPGT